MVTERNEHVTDEQNAQTAHCHNLRKVGGLRAKSQVYTARQSIVDTVSNTVSR